MIEPGYFCLQQSLHHGLGHEEGGSVDGRALLEFLRGKVAS
jgi:hypothetical protein